MTIQDFLLYSVEGLAIVLAILDFMDKTKKLEASIRSAMESVRGWIDRNPIGEYIKAGFRTSREYALGVLFGGVLFIFLAYVFGSDDIPSIVLAIVLLYSFVLRNLLPTRYRTGFIYGAAMLLLVNRSDTTSVRGFLSLVIAAVLLVVIQVFAPVLLASVCYLLLFSLHRILVLLSTPKKGIVGTISLILAIGLPVASRVFQ